MKISTIISQTKTALKKCDANANGTVTTGEIAAAKKAGKITPAQAALLQRVASDIRQGQTVPNYLSQLDLYKASAKAADADKDGVLSKKEASTASDTFTNTAGKSVWSNRSMLKKLAAF